MSDAYNVRSNGDRYYVYRIDGNVPVAEYLGPGAAAKAQRETAIRNQQHNEQFGKKKEPEPTPSSDGWVEGQNLPADSTFTGTPPQPEPAPQPSQPPKAKKSEAPDPPPGQGVSY